MDDRRKRLIYRAMHRGTKEADLIVGGFFTTAAATLNETQLAEAEALLEESDLDLVEWVMGRQPVPEQWRGTVLDDLMTHYRTNTTG